MNRLCTNNTDLVLLAYMFPIIIDLTACRYYSDIQKSNNIGSYLMRNSNTELALYPYTYKQGRLTMSSQIEVIPFGMILNT